MQETSPTSSAKHAVRMRRYCFIALVILMAPTGVRAAVIPEQEETGIGSWLLTLATALFVTSWALFDGRVRGKPLIMSASRWMFWTCPVAFPIYCVWSRGARGVLFCLGFVAILLLSTVAAGFITVYALGFQY